MENQKGFLMLPLALLLCLLIGFIFDGKTSRSASAAFCCFGGIMSLATIAMAMGLHFKWPGFIPAIPKNANLIRNFLVFSGAIPTYVLVTVLSIVRLLRYQGNI